MSVATASIIVIGNEVLSGKVEEQNARYLIGELRELGVSLQCVLIIPDEPAQIAAAARTLAASNDYVFTTGGVGPTHDDVTIQSIAMAFDKPVVRDPRLEKLLRGFFGEAIDSSRLRMADIPQDTELIFAGDMKYPVLACENVYIFPGVPELLRRKFSAVRERFRVAPFCLRVVHTLEDEFDLADRLRRVAETNPDVSIGSYPNFQDPAYRVRVTLESKSHPAVEKAFADLMDALDNTRVVEP